METRIITDRLHLRPVLASDAAALIAGLNEFDVARWLAKVPHPYADADAQEFLGWACDQWPRVAAVTYDDRFIGLVDTTGDGLGYWLVKDQWGKGFATEMASAMVSSYFAITDNDTLGSGYFVGNAASARVLEKLGFLPTDRVELFCEALGETMPHQNLALTRADWRPA